MSSFGTGRGRYFRSKDEKLVKRLYEPLVLLRCLNIAQGDRIPQQELPMGQTAASERRQILYHLSSVCDFDKGGNTVTALGLEKKPSGPTYWVAAPSRLESTIVPFLRKTLETLATVECRTGKGTDQETIEVELFESFAIFCRRRLMKTWKYLQKSVKQESALATSQEHRDWLELCKLPPSSESLSNESLFRFCRWAYEARRSPFTKPRPASPPDQQSLPSVRHFLGRIGSILRAAKYVVQLAPKHVELFESFDIHAVTCGGPQDGPTVDILLELDGIARRMTSDEMLIRDLTTALARIDGTEHHLMQNIRSYYEDPNFRPKVHAEVAVLDALHGAKAEFFDYDRFVACSKASCFCCYHYFCCHPGRFATPASHNNIWLNWRVPDLENPENPAEIQARKVMMNKFIHQIRPVVIEEVLNRSGLARGWHADSSSGYTKPEQIIAASLAAQNHTMPPTDTRSSSPDFGSEGANESDSPPPDSDPAWTSESRSPSPDHRSDLTSQNDSSVPDPDAGGSWMRKAEESLANLSLYPTDEEVGGVSLIDCAIEARLWSH